MLLGGTTIGRMLDVGAVTDLHKYTGPRLVLPKLWYAFTAVPVFLYFFLPNLGLYIVKNMYIQGVPGGMCQTSGGCSLC